MRSRQAGETGANPARRRHPQKLAPETCTCSRQRQPAMFAAHLGQPDLLQRQGGAQHAQREGSRQRGELQLQALRMGCSGPGAAKLGLPQQQRAEADFGGQDACRERGTREPRFNQFAWVQPYSVCTQVPCAVWCCPSLPQQRGCWRRRRRCLRRPHLCLCGSLCRPPARCPPAGSRCGSPRWPAGAERG